MRSLGIDIIEINRIENMEELAKRILSEKEIILFNQYPLPRKQEFLAGRWALKEAIFKALPQEKIAFKNIDISYNEFNQPITFIKNYQLFLSLSHNETNAVAVVVVI